MRRRHDLGALLKYMGMLSVGYSIDYIHKKYGISHDRLKSLWQQYRDHGPSVLHRKPHIRADGALRQQIVFEVAKKHLTLVEASLKYDVSTSQLSVWLRKARDCGIEALAEIKPRGRPPKNMGRAKKKCPEEMTELELLRDEVERLRIENALLKKVKALVEERESRLRAIGQEQSEN